jgi:hypothetical protein
MATKKKALSSPALATALGYVIRTDLTAVYKIDQPNRNGDKPPVGTAWKTPRQYAIAVLNAIGEPMKAKRLGQEAEQP